MKKRTEFQDNVDYSPGEATDYPRHDAVVTRRERAPKASKKAKGAKKMAKPGKTKKGRC